VRGAPPFSKSGTGRGRDGSTSRDGWVSALLCSAAGRLPVALLAASLALALTPQAGALVPPSASFTISPNPALTGETVSFDGSASTPDSTEGGSITSYQWDLDGDGGFDDATGQTASTTYSNAGTVTVGLQVTDSENDIDEQTRSLKIHRAPTASFSATPNPALTGQTVTFNGSGSSDPDGAIASYSWDLDGNGSFETNSGSNATVSRSYPTATTLTIKLRVTDGDGATDDEQLTLTIRNRAPTASFTATPNPALTGKTVTFKGSGSSDPDGRVTRYQWDLDGNGSFETNSGSNATVSRSYAAAASPTIRLRVTDDRGGTGETSRGLVIHRPPDADFAFWPEEPVPGEQVEFWSLSRDPDGPLRTLKWDFDEDGKFDDGTGARVTRSFREPGFHVVRLQATDARGASDVAVEVVSVGFEDDALPPLMSPFPVVRLAGEVRSRGTRIARFAVRAAPGAKVTVRCRGRSCPLRRSARRARSRSVRFRRLERVLRPGTRISVSVTKAGEIGKYTRFRIRARKAPARLDRCLVPGDDDPTRCPRR
jgi:YD repeat-containing protein